VSQSCEIHDTDHVPWIVPWIENAKTYQIHVPAGAATITVADIG